MLKRFKLYSCQFAMLFYFYEQTYYVKMLRYYLLCDCDIYVVTDIIIIIIFIIIIMFL